MTLKVHHIEFCVKNPDPVIHALVTQYGFIRMGHRTTLTCSQTVLKSGKTVFLVTSRNHEFLLQGSFEQFTYFCCSGNPKGHTIDSAFNISIQVENLGEILEDLRKNLGANKFTLLLPMEVVEDSYGTVKYCVIKSICGNLIHTLVEKGNYKGWFLPGFIRDDVSEQSQPPCLTTHLDHLALACGEGETDKIIEWYTAGFGMKRFMSNRLESLEDGLQIGGDVGMRLKVMEFWKCSELGICSGDASLDDSMKIVIAESLPNIKNAQIEGYLKNHGTSGLQHVGLYTTSMLTTVSKMVEAGAKFRHPPPTYYTEIGQLDAIKSVNESVEMLKKFGILLDTEADFDGTNSDQEKKYLMQIFTNSLFTNDTFILEVIERKGANGFGIGNISALTRSIIAFNQSQSSKMPPNQEDKGTIIVGRHAAA